MSLSQNCALSLRILDYLRQGSICNTQIYELSLSGDPFSLQALVEIHDTHDVLLQVIDGSL